MDAYHTGTASAQFPLDVSHLQSTPGDCGHRSRFRRVVAPDRRMVAIRDRRAGETGIALHTPLARESTAVFRFLALACPGPADLLGVVQKLFQLPRHVAG